MRIHIRSLAILCLGGFAAVTASAAEPAAPPAAPAPAPAPATLVTSSGRQVFWRGEAIGLSFDAPLAAPAPATVTVRLGANGQPLPVFRGPLTVANGRGALHLLLPSGALGNGVYTATASAESAKADVTFTVRDTVVTSPGMIGDDSCGWQPLAASSRLAKQTAYFAFMNGGPFDFTGARSSGSPAEWNHVFDQYADQQILFWLQDSTRPMSFCPPHSSPNTDGEYLRRMVLGQTCLLRYPAFAGYLFDYDPTGFLDKQAQLTTYWQWGKLREDLATYMKSQEDALRANFKKDTGSDAPTPAELMRLAAAVGSPEAMGYIDLPTRRWATQVAARSPQLDAKELAALRDRSFAWYDKLMTLSQKRYETYLAGLPAGLANSTSNTINHCTPRDGGYHPASYAPLPFRFSSVWDDQGGAPEHIYETALAATLLGTGKPATTPLWIDTVFGWLNGHHFRNTLLLVGRGAQGTGYSSEMGCNLGANARAMLGGNSDKNQEVAANGLLMERLGALFAAAQPLPRVGILYSKRQISMTPYAQSYVDGSFKMQYLLSHTGLTPCLVTEEMLAASGVPQSVKAIVVLRQSEEMPAPAQAGLAKFAAAGGLVAADTASTVKWDFLKRDAALDLPFWDLGHPYNMLTAYDRQDATICDLRKLAAERCPRLRALLQGVLRTLPLDCTNPDVGLAELQGGAATFVVVTNDAQLDLSQLFTPEQRRTSAYQSLLVGHGTGALGSWMPLATELLLAPELAELIPFDSRPINPRSYRRGVVYDLLRQVQVTPATRGGAAAIPCDMTTLPGGLYAVYPGPVGGGTLTLPTTVAAGETVRVEYHATHALVGPMPAVVPVEVRLLRPDGQAHFACFRATDATGAAAIDLPTGALDPAGSYAVEVRQLLDGRGVRHTVKVKAGPGIAAAAAPAVAVRNPQALAEFLKAKRELVIPVFDAAMKPFAESAAAALTKRGVKARVWENPPMVDYALGYVVKPEQQPVNAKVDAGEAFGKVLFRNSVEHVNGNFYGTALPGWRCGGKNVLLLGIPGKNPVLDAIRESGLLWTDRSIDAPGHGAVQVLPQALSRDADTLALAAADADGLNAAVAALATAPVQDAVSVGVQTVRTELLKGRGLHAPQLGIVTLSGLVPRGRDELPARALAWPGLVPVQQVTESGRMLVATLGRYAQNVVVVNGKGDVALVLPAVSTTGQTAFGKNVLVTSMPGLVCAWSRDGNLLWRARGEFRAILPDSDAVVLELDKRLYQVAPDGTAAASDWKAPEAKPAVPPFKTEVIVERKGNDEIVKAVKVTHVASGKDVSGLRFTTEKQNWSVPPTVQDNLASDATGNVLLVFRRWPGENGAQVYDHRTGKLVRLSLPTAYLTDAALSADGTQVALAGMEGQVRVFDTAGVGLGGGLTVGAYPRLFVLPSGGFAAGSQDGRLVRIDASGKALWNCDVLAATRQADPEVVYAVHRTAKLVTPPPAAESATAGIRLEAFYNYLRDEAGELKMINWPPATAHRDANIAFDFRWMDAIQGEVSFPAARAYTVTIRAAAKYFDQEPMAQPSWEPILALRKLVIKGERPAPEFAVYADGKRVGTLTPEGGALKPFATAVIKEGWASLNPKPEELTTFAGTVELKAGTHLFGIEALNMEDCYVKGLEVK